jgi:biopolymer transport protein ExbD
MTWKVRHQGSPRSIEGLSRSQVVAGLQDNLWEPTDEVMGPDDPQWIAIENHPKFAEVAMDLEPPPRPVHEDEARLDMNPLIDVALVLLIFFIMTASYAALQKVLPMPDFSNEKVEGPLKLTPVIIERSIISVRAVQESAGPVVYIEDNRIPIDSLRNGFNQYVRSTQKTEAMLDVKGVSWGTVVAIQDAAKAAGISKVYFLSRPRTPRK